MSKTLIRTSLTLLFICAIAAGLVAVVYHVTLPISEKRAAQEEKEAVLSVFPEADGLAEKALTPAGNVEKFTLYSDPESGEVRGFVGVVKGTGFGGAIRFVMAADESGKLLGVRVLSHSETPGVGSRVVEGEFLTSLSGALYPVAEKVDTVSGATISSRAVLAVADEFLLLARKEAAA